LVVCHKIRNAPNKIVSIDVTGTVKNIHAIIVDDIIDTGNTLYTVAQELKKQGAYSVRALCTHPVFSGYAYNHLASSVLEEIIVTNTIPLEQKNNKTKVVNIAPCIFEFIKKAAVDKYRL